MGEGFNDDNDFHCYICFKPIEFIESLNQFNNLWSNNDARPIQFLGSH